MAKRKSWIPSKEKLDIIRSELGDELAEHFHTKFRIAKERCCNPKNKDYDEYKGKFKFEDFSDFFDNCYGDFKNALDLYNTRLSIDRIDGNKGYEPGNVRFVPMSVNLKNKSNIKPIKIIDTINNEEYGFKTFWEARTFLNGSGAMFNAYKNGTLYRNQYYIESIE